MSVAIGLLRAAWALATAVGVIFGTTACASIRIVDSILVMPLEVEVTDEATGKPLEGAQLVFEDVTLVGSGSRLPSRTVGLTGPDGCYRGTLRLAWGEKIGNGAQMQKPSDRLFALRIDAVGYKAHRVEYSLVAAQAADPFRTAFRLVKE